MTSVTLSPCVVSDTDAASFVVKDDPIRGPRYRRHFAGQLIVLPFCVIAELRLGAEFRSWGSLRRSRLESFLRSGLIKFPDDTLCTLWAQLVAAQRHRGRPIAQHDAWVAATALYLGAPLVTHNAAHFAGIAGLRVITEPDTHP